MKRPIILSLDGYKTACNLLTTLDLLLANQYLPKMNSFVKVNEAVHNSDISGPPFIGALLNRLKPYGLGLMLDFKLADVSDTDKNTLEHYREVLERYSDVSIILTVRESLSAKAFMMLRREFPFLRITVVSNLTDMSVEECQMRYGTTPDIKILGDSHNIKKAYDWAIAKAKAEGKDEFNYPQNPFDLLVCSPNELTFLQTNMWDGCGYICPGIRDEWMLKGAKGSQERIMGIKEALDLVVDDNEVYFVMATQLIKGNKNTGITAEISTQMTFDRMNQSDAIKIERGSPYNTMFNFNALYEGPLDASDKPLGPLVVYAGKYDGKNNWVGLNYFNVAKLEESSKSRSCFTKLAVRSISQIQPDAIIGTAMGGITFAPLVATACRLRYGFAEKKVIQASNPEMGIPKDISKMVITRHEIKKGDRIVVFEDVCNNFSTTAEIIKLITELGGEVIAIVCIVNRSKLNDWEGIPVLSVIHVPTPEYRQDDPYVADLVQAGNVVWNPKPEWSRLKEAMKVKTD